MGDRLPESDVHLAKLLIEQGLARPEHVEECLRSIADLARQGVTPLPQLGTLLTRKGYLTAAEMEATVRIGSRGGPAPAGETGLPEEAARAAAEPANLIGRYVRSSRLGAGGMGEVWRAWDKELRRWVALKFLRSEDPDELARFTREAQTSAKLAHPNIAAVHDVGAHDGRPYIAMQLLEGRTLVAFPRADRKLMAELVRDAALAVHYAHEQGVIHRDLKPHNIMVEGTPKQGSKSSRRIPGRTGASGLRIYVMDFGLAKQTSVDSSLSASGSIVGTPSYMPPEQARGHLGKVNARSDVYSLGATLYELLADRPPFQHANVYDLLCKVVREDPKPLRKVDPKIDADVETIVSKSMEKDPARRYASALESARSDFAAAAADLRKAIELSPALKLDLQPLIAACEKK